MIWTGEHDFTLDGQAFHSHTLRSLRDGPAAGLQILKPRSVIEQYVELVERERPQRILELGIYAGGSTALLAALAKPERLVALDHAPGPQQGLADFLAARQLNVELHYSTDQSDPEALDQIVAGFDGPIDLVIDDASHLEPLSRASFEHLFPHVREGGAYVIEDWAWAHQPVVANDPAYHGVTPLSALVCEIVLALRRCPGVGRVEMSASWALIRRGPGPLDGFVLRDELDPVARKMAGALSEIRSKEPHRP